MALSKPMKEIFSVPVPRGWVEGGTVPGGGDFHCWVENDAGTVVYDPHFSCYENICDIRGLDINKPVYQVWPNQEKWIKRTCPYQLKWIELVKGKNPKKALKIMKSQTISDCRGTVSYMAQNETMSDWYNNPQDHMCNLNAWAWYINQLYVKRSKNLHIKIGSMGWRTNNNDTKAFYEFG